MQFAMDHIVLNVSDLEGMLRFYTEVMGFPTERLEAYRNEDAPFPSVRVNSETIIDLFPPGMWGGSQQAEGAKPDLRLNHFCLVVKEDDWNFFLDRLERLHVPIIEGPVERWGAHGTGVSVYFHDPEKNKIEVRHYPSGEKGNATRLTS